MIVGGASAAIAARGARRAAATPTRAPIAAAPAAAATPAATPASAATPAPAPAAAAAAAVAAARAQADDGPSRAAAATAPSASVAVVVAAAAAALIAAVAAASPQRGAMARLVHCVCAGHPVRLVVSSRAYKVACSRLYLIHQANASAGVFARRSDQGYRARDGTKARSALDIYVRGLEVAVE